MLYHQYPTKAKKKQIFQKLRNVGKSAKINTSLTIATAFETPSRMSAGGNLRLRLRLCDPG